MSALDLGIARLPIKPREKIKTREFFQNEYDFFSLLEKNELPIFLNRVLRAKINADEIKKLTEQDILLARKRGIRYVSWVDSAYPPLLREIFDPPVVLFYRGILPDAEKPLLAIVGTRKPSGRSSTTAYAIAREFGGLGYSVVSGLALGVDAMAHRGNLSAGVPSFAVLGSSPDCVYPITNRAIARNILERGGALLSEYPPDSLPAKWRFPARNRIISGLARATLVVEAPEKSGALITARYALEQNRDLWVTQAGVESPVGKGTAQLAENGAKIAFSGADILKDWGFL
jgi:DNA processing protein